MSPAYERPCNHRRCESYTSWYIFFHVLLANYKQMHITVQGQSYSYSNFQMVIRTYIQVTSDTTQICLTTSFVGWSMLKICFLIQPIVIPCIYSHHKVKYE